jgi:hypothetical protein
VAGFLAVVVQVLDHDPPAPGLSLSGLLTIALAAAVVALLTIHRRYGPRPLARALAEYTVVALLATLLAAPGIVQPTDPAKPTTASQAKPQAEAAAGDDQPGAFRAGATVLRAVTRGARALAAAVRWVVDLWRQASEKADAANDQAMATPPPSPSQPPSAASSWRSHA